MYLFKSCLLNLVGKKNKHSLHPYYTGNSSGRRPTLHGWRTGQCSGCLLPKGWIVTFCLNCTCSTWWVFLSLSSCYLKINILYIWEKKKNLHKTYVTLREGEWTYNSFSMLISHWEFTAEKLNYVNASIWGDEMS